MPLLRTVLLAALATTAVGLLAWQLLGSVVRLLRGEGRASPVESGRQGRSRRT